MTANSKHTWSFFRAGGFDQVRLNDGADIAHLDNLDQKLWVALACPTTGLEFDSKTLGLIDMDKDGRIRPPEIIAAARWATACLKNPDDLLKGSASLPLAAINDAAPEGKQLLSSARQILSTLGKANATEISVEDTTDTARILAQTRFNGDGIVPADAASDAATQAVINDIIACCGAETDRSGKPGVSLAKVDEFFAAARAFSDWWKKAETDKAILPLGDATAGASSAVKAVRAKVDDYFARCRLAAFDDRAIGALNRHETEYLALAAKDLTITAPEVAGFPLARIAAGKPLPLKTGVNPAWAAAVAALQAQAVKPLLGDKAELTEADWAALTARFGPYDAWLAAKAGPAVEKLGVARVREILAGKSRDAIAALIAQDQTLEPEFNALTAVDRLVRYHRDFAQLLNNFVSFRDFYGRKKKAIFQAGTLYLDQRACDLCIRVDDMARHAAMATLSQMYLAYCDCTRKSDGAKMTMLAVFTGGDSDSLMVGRNGVFYDRQGRDWDATIIRIVDNPISIRQAFWAPYKKFIRLIEEQVAKRAAAAEAATSTRMQSTAAGVTQAAPGAPPPPTKIDTGTLAAIGLVLATLLAALGGIFGAFTKLPLWQMPMAIVGIILAISIPSMLIAWLKLRQRNLGPVLDANGWAINTRAKINIAFGGSLTSVAALPPGAHRDLTDPYAESHAGRNRLILLLIALAVLVVGWYFGAIERVLPGVLPKSGWIQRREPAAQPPPPPPPAPASPAQPAQPAPAAPAETK
jgi:hypothetical protein